MHNPSIPCGLVVRLVFPALSLAPLGLASVARGDVYQGFNYPVGADIAAGSLSDPSGTLATSGNHFLGINGAFREIGPLQTFGTPGTDVWISWLQRRDRTAPGWQGLAVIRREGSMGTGVYFIGEPGSGPGDNTFVIGQAGNDETVVSSGVPVVPNETAFLVAHLQFQQGNDLATLYVNPTPGAAAPSGGFAYSGLDMPEIQPFLELQGTGTGVTHEFDELRIGSTYAAVAPVPEPAALAAALLPAMGLLRRPR
jgi:hypothetical protein